MLHQKPMDSDQQSEEVTVIKPNVPPPSGTLSITY